MLETLRSPALRSSLWLAVFTTAAAFALHAWIGPADTFWTIDNGGKALVVANLQEDAGRTWVDYPGAAIDPSGRWFPQPLGGSEPYGTRREGRVLSQYASPFSWLALPGASAWGFLGLGLIPALGALAGISLAALASFPAGQDDALALLRTNSAVVFLPWAVAVFFIPATRPRRGVAAARDPLVATALLFLGLFLVLVPERSITGVHPGPRMLLPLLPLAAVLATERFPRGPLVGLAFLITLGAGTLWSARSLELLHANRVHAGALADAIRSDPRRIVATDLFWLPTELSPPWKEKQFHLVTGPESLQALAAAAAAGGARKMLLVTSPGRVASSGAAAPSRAVTSARFPEFSVELHPQRLAPAPPNPEDRP
ncbi:MAG: hypothetical protein ACYTG4_15595 [Planctomycetota bacterium]|jgi:hypothetical protein